MKNRIFSDDVLHNLFDCFLLIMTKQAFICTKMMNRCFHRIKNRLYIIPKQKKGVPDRNTFFLLYHILLYFDIREPDAEAGAEGDTHRSVDIREVQCGSGAVVHQSDLDITVQLAGKIVLQHGGVIRVDRT